MGAKKNKNIILWNKKNTIFANLLENRQKGWGNVRIKVSNKLNN